VLRLERLHATSRPLTKRSARDVRGLNDVAQRGNDGKFIQDADSIVVVERHGEGTGEPVLTVRAFAKINLDLRVLGVRADGYHEIATVFQTIALADTVTVVPHEGPLSVRCDAPGVPAGRGNLAWRAAEHLWSLAGRPGTPHGCAIVIEKRIPVAGGLGGGSADAAATLVALAHCWRLPCSARDLHHVARALGADVPFFLVGGTALGRGAGDELEPLDDLPRHEVVLAVPGFGVSAADAYRWLDEDGPAGPGGLEPPRSPPGPEPASLHRPPAAAGDWAGWLARCRNDLEPPVARRHPEVARLAADLRRAGARLAALSGSGSTVFGLYEDAAAADRAARALEAGGRVVVVRTRTLSREAWRRAVFGEA
jgi:4-diphosphocytidyl-2-C-methyl-D-erythritol kinase